MENEFMGYGLFNDIEDSELRARNRAVSMGNIAELHLTEEGISPEGNTLLSGYFGEVPIFERANTFVAFLNQLELLKIDAAIVVRAAQS